jgi:serine/threonine protein kinase
MARLTDFGIAKAESRINSTRPGELKGKISFMSPEQIRNPESVDHRSDVFSAGVLLWTALTGKHLFEAESTGAAMNNTLRMAVEPPSRVGLRPPAVFDAICLRALERNVEARLDSALIFEESLRSAATANGLCGSRREVGEWVLAAVGEELAERRNINRSSGNQRAARRIHSPAAGIGEGSDSRLRVASALNESVPSIEPISIVSSSHSAKRESSPVIESAPISARELGTEGRRRSQWLLAGGGLVLVGGLAWGATRLDLAPSSAPALASSAAKPAQFGIAATHSAPPAPAEETKPAAADQKVSAQRVHESESTEPSRVEPTRRRAPQMALRRSASTAPQPAGVATPAPPSKPESAAASEPRPKKPVWDEDSPLPHP